MRLSVIIINYNRFDLTCDCIRSVIRLTEGIDFEIVLVDNASTECDPGRFLREFSKIKLVRSPDNAGFARGNNLGIAASQGEYILLLNNDTLFRENSASLCLDYLKERKDIGVLGCRMIYPDGQVQYSARRFRSIGWELLDLFRFIPWLMPYKKRSRQMLGKYFRHDENMECDWVNGAFFLFPRKLLQQMEGQKLDERFFMYGEDQLWCEQAKERGYKIMFFAGTTIIHINSGSTERKKLVALRRTMMKHEMEIMRNRKGRGLYYFFFKLIFGAKEGTRNLVKSLILRSTGRVLR